MPKVHQIDDIEQKHADLLCVLLAGPWTHQDVNGFQGLLTADRGCERQEPENKE